MTDSPDAFIPEADSHEQRVPVTPPDLVNEPVALAPDVPEADAIEQTLPGPLPDEDDAPR
jgi:hypothetical protein